MKGVLRKLAFPDLFRAIALVAPVAHKNRPDIIIWVVLHVRRDRPNRVQLALTPVVLAVNTEHAGHDGFHGRAVGRAKQALRLVDGSLKQHKEGWLAGREGIALAKTQLCRSRFARINRTVESVPPWGIEVVDGLVGVELCMQCVTIIQERRIAIGSKRHVVIVVDIVITPGESAGEGCREPIQMAMESACASESADERIPAVRRIHMIEVGLLGAVPKIRDFYQCIVDNYGLAEEMAKRRARHAWIVPLPSPPRVDRKAAEIDLSPLEIEVESSDATENLQEHQMLREETTIPFRQRGPNTCVP